MFSACSSSHINIFKTIILSLQLIITDIFDHSQVARAVAAANSTRWLELLQKSRIGPSLW